MCTSVQEVAQEIIDKAVAAKRDEVLLLQSFILPHLQVSQVSALASKYAICVKRDDLERILYYEYICLWDEDGKNWMPEVVTQVSQYNEDTAFLMEQVKFCGKDIFAAVPEGEELKFYCARATCLYFRGCYCNNPLPFRDYVILDESKAHRFYSKM